MSELPRRAAPETYTSAAIAPLQRSLKVIHPDYVSPNTGTPTRLRDIGAMVAAVNISIVVHRTAPAASARDDQTSDTLLVLQIVRIRRACLDLKAHVLSL